MDRAVKSGVEPPRSKAGCACTENHASREDVDLDEDLTDTGQIDRSRLDGVGTRGSAQEYNRVLRPRPQGKGASHFRQPRDRSRAFRSPIVVLTHQLAARGQYPDRGIS